MRSERKAKICGPTYNLNLIPVPMGRPMEGSYAEERCYAFVFRMITLAG